MLSEGVGGELHPSTLVQALAEPCTRNRSLGSFEREDEGEPVNDRHLESEQTSR